MSAEGRSKPKPQLPERSSMNAWVHIDTGLVPGGGKSLALMQKGDEFSIVVDAIELMNSTRGTSEEALAALTCERLSHTPAPRVLIGGLGMGFTLRAALRTLGPQAEIVVAELVPAVAAWARGPLAQVFGGCLDDPRVHLCEADVNRLIQSGAAGWDAILLDVDNGPEGLMRRANDRLYDTWGLKRVQWALKPGGVLGVWSGTPDRKFKARLQRLGFAVEEVRIPASGNSGPRHVVWVATQGAAAAG
ncbi:Polyamine aminopropyltransferase [Methylobacterium dankookense]|uniref:Polyamine aminopropyltransferase n=2 Tax=Methylobacterium dankookense TaxID=560405 RepID=A0A564FSP1_9HYPH|nr:Polyamine aminopropyltransferase [Methylobacterium dankookense]VUF11083.1 Polyamine aminopropyltransferase [Methylobacterium dankookense]